MEKRVILEMRGKKPEEVKKLVLDCCRSTSITGITDKFCNLETLSIMNAGLTNLKGLPKLPKLKKLDLSDNKISSGLDILKDNCPELTHLHLCANKIDKIEVLEPLRNLSNLTSLDLSTCEVTSLENYRDEVFKDLPHLKYLDGLDKDKEEESLDDDEADEDSEDDDNEIGLAYLQKPQIDEESEGDEYAPGVDVDDIVDDDEDEDDDEVDEEDDVDDEDDDSEEESPKGQKRKLEAE